MSSTILIARMCANRLGVSLVSLYVWTQGDLRLVCLPISFNRWSNYKLILPYITQGIRGLKKTMNLEIFMRI